MLNYRNLKGFGEKTVNHPKEWNGVLRIMAVHKKTQNHLNTKKY